MVQPLQAIMASAARQWWFANPSLIAAQQEIDCKAPSASSSTPTSGPSLRVDIVGTCPGPLRQGGPRQQARPMGWANLFCPGPRLRVG